MMIIEVRIEKLYLATDSHAIELPPELLIIWISDLAVKTRPQQKSFIPSIPLYYCAIPPRAIRPANREERYSHPLAFISI